MRKQFAFLFLLVLLLVLAACSKPESEEAKPVSQEGASNGDAAAEELEPEEGAELVVWGNDDEEGEWMQEVASKFTDEYGIPVTFEEVDHGESVQKLQTDGPAGLGGDVFMAPHDRVGQMNASGLIYDNHYAEEYKERLIDGVAEAVSAIEDDEQKMYGFPIAIETVALMYNKDLLDEMGFEPAETMDELIDQSKQFMDKNPGTYGFMLEPGNFYGNYSFIGANGGYIFGEENTNAEDIGLNKEPALEAAALLEEIRDEILPLSSEDLTADVINSYFNEGKLLYITDGSWGPPGRVEAGLNIGVKVMPKLDNGEVPTTFLGVKSLYVNSYSEYPKAATLFAKFATSDEMLLSHFDYTENLPPTKTLIENEKIQSDELIYPFLEQAEYAIPMPNIQEMESVWGGMEAALTAIWNDTSEPQEALDKGVEQIQNAIDSQTN